MRNLDTGGPAFPKLTQDERWKTFKSTDGMTLRDYFAAKAMMGLIVDVEGHDYIAEFSYKMADAMLKWREK